MFANVIKWELWTETSLEIFGKVGESVDKENKLK
jgi:hypothetical protein